MKRVALFPSAFHPSLGGVEELTGQLALQMVKRGGGVLICTNCWPRTLSVRELWKGVVVHRFRFRLPEDNLKARVSFRLTGMRILGEVVRTLERFRAEVVHVHCVSGNAWYAARAAEALGLKAGSRDTSSRPNTLPASSRTKISVRVAREVGTCMELAMRART